MPENLSNEAKELRWLFLRELTRHILINARPAEEIEPAENAKVAHSYQGMIPSPRTRSQAPLIQPRQSIPWNAKYPGVRIPAGQMDLGKLNILLLDPRVQQIDCNGPDKNILVKISGLIQTTPLKLSKDEIDKLIQDFSEKTRIPRVKGVFKAAIGKLILTAVTSDFVDTRFTLEKRSPFQDVARSRF